MLTKSYSNISTLEREKQYIGKRLDEYAKFYWRGEDMWETYSAFIESNGTVPKFVNGPSFSNQYSSPQYDHATGNLTGVKFSRMKTSFPVCVYGVTAEKYREFIDALGPYEVDYLAFAYDTKLAYLAKTTDLKEGTKYVVGRTGGENPQDLYMVELTLTFEIQGEQCAIAQRQYIWRPDEIAPSLITTDSYCAAKLPNPFPSDLMESSEIAFGVVGEIEFKANDLSQDGFVMLYVSDVAPEDVQDAETFFAEEATQLFQVQLSSLSKNWQLTQNSNAINQLDYSITIKYDSSSGLIFMKYDDADYKILNLLTTNTYGDYILQNETSIKMKIAKRQKVNEVYFYWRLSNLTFMLNTDNKIDPTTVNVYGRAKAILV